MNLFQCFLFILLVSLIEGQWIVHTVKSTNRPTTQFTTVRETTIPTTSTIIGDSFTTTTTKHTTVPQATRTTRKITTTEKQSATSTTRKTASSTTTVPKPSTTTTEKTITRPPTTTRIIFDWFTTSSTTTYRTTVQPSTTPRITHDWFTTPTTTTPRTTTVPHKTIPPSTPTTSTKPRTTTISKATTTLPWYVWETLCNLLPEEYLLIDHEEENTHVSVTVNSTCIAPNQVLEVKLSISDEDRDEYVSLLQVQKMYETMACGEFIHAKEGTVISCGKPYSNNTYYGHVPSNLLWKAPNDLKEDIIVNATVVDTEGGKYWSDVMSQVIMFDPFCNNDVMPPVSGAPALKTYPWWSLVCSLLITLGIWTVAQ